MSCANGGAKVTRLCVSLLCTIKVRVSVQVKTLVPFYSMWDPAGGCILLMKGSATSLNVAGFGVSTTDPGKLFHSRIDLGKVANLNASIVALGMTYLAGWSCLPK